MARGPAARESTTTSKPREASVHLADAFTPDAAFDVVPDWIALIDADCTVRRVNAAMAAAFGVSRPAFYAAAASFEQAGLLGLVPERPGPRRAHKLSGPVVDALAASRSVEPGLTSADLARIAEERFGLVVHRRSVERALARRKRGLRQQG